MNVTTSNHGSDVTGVAVVTILDNNTPVNGATVSGSWSGAASDPDSAVTGATGTVTVYSDEKIYNGGTDTLTFTFTVNGVTHSSYTWDNKTENDTEVYP